MSSSSLKNFLIELAVCTAVIIVTGQLTANFWERYALQKELYNMKSNLHMLKITVNNIGSAYDSLQNELSELARRDEQVRAVPRQNTKFSYKAPDYGTSKRLKKELITEFNDREIDSDINEYNTDLSETKDTTTSTFPSNHQEQCSCKLKGTLHRCYENDSCNCY